MKLSSVILQALKATNLIRQAIATESRDYEFLLKGEVEADESYFGGRRKGKRGRGAANKIPVFGILERNGIVSVDVVPNVGTQTLLNMTIKPRKGSPWQYSLHRQVSLL